MEKSRWAQGLRSVGWLATPAVLTALAFIFPPAALVPVLVLGVLYIFSRRSSEVRGAGVGMALVILAFIGSNSAPSELRVVAVIVAVVVVLLTSVLGDRRAVSKKATVVVFLGYLAYSILISLALGSSSIVTLAVLLGAILAVALASMRFSAEDFVAMARWLVAAAGVQLLIAVAELFVLSTPIWGFRNLTTAGVPVLRYNPFLGDAVLRTQGTFGHPIPLALFLIFVLFVCLAPAMKAHRLLRWSGILIAVSGLFLSGTRSAAIAVGAALLYFLVSSRGFKAKTRNVVIISIVAAVVFIGDFGLRGILFDLLASDSLAHRVDGWTLATGLLGRGAVSVLFGTGLNSEVATFQAGYLQQDGFNVIDNQMLTLFVTTGITGLLLFFAALVIGWLQSGRSGRALILAIGVMFFSFDITTWPVAFSLLAVAFALPRESMEAVASDAPAPEEGPSAVPERSGLASTA